MDEYVLKLVESLFCITFSKFSMSTKSDKEIHEEYISYGILNIIIYFLL